MYVGVNLPYDWFEITEEQEKIIGLIDPEVVVVMSNTPSYILSWLLTNCHNIHRWVVRAKTGPQKLGDYPVGILTYDEWKPYGGYEQTLKDTIEFLTANGIEPWVVLGNEPDIEMSDDPENSNEFYKYAKRYASWFIRERESIKSQYPEILVGTAALSQGNHERFGAWHIGMSEALLAADFITEHCYIGKPAEEWQLRFIEVFLGYKDKPLLVTEFNDNGTGRDNLMYADVANWIESQDLPVESLAFFTIEGGSNTKQNRPEWWFINREEAQLLGTRNKWFTSQFSLADPYPDEIVAEEGPTLGLEKVDAFIQLWVLEGLFTHWTNNDYTGIFKAWAEQPDLYGSPIAEEFTAEDGEVYQAFTRGVFKYSNGKLEKVSAWS